MATGLGKNHHTTTVAILFDHGVDSVVALLAVLKAGKIYVPLDSRFPGKRLTQMLRHFDIRMIVTNTRNVQLAERLRAGAGKKISIINLGNLPESLAPENLNMQIPDDAVAYILHTSGSGGKPKGVVQSCRNVLFFTDAYIKALSISSADCLTFLSSFSFDGTVEDIYPALLSGATLHPFDIGEKGIERIGQWLVKEKITVYHSVPTVFRYFITTLTGKEQFPHLRIICMGAEPLRSSDVKITGEFFPKTRLAHMYGQTESSVNTMGFLETHNKKITIGEPVDGVQLYLFNKEGEEVETFEIGEIYVASDYTAVGYWKDPEETAKQFLYDENLGRLYRTGDLGRIDPEGKIEFMGRKDNQVKIRGFRIEPGEIESHLLGFDFIKGAAVIDREEEGEKYLYAYIVTDKECEREISRLGELLSAKLPAYMIPTQIVFLDQLPFMPNGKLDRKALPKPETVRSMKKYVPPRDEKEEKLVEIWSNILKIEKEKISIEESFFELGGHSLKATLMALEIHKNLNVEVPLAKIFDTPRIKDLSEYIKGLTLAENQFAPLVAVEEKEYYPLSSAQKRFYVLQQMAPTNTSFNVSITEMWQAQIDLERIEETFRKLEKRHESLRTSFELVNGEPAQKVHASGEVEFEFHYDDISGTDGKQQPAAPIIERFFRAFDLSQAPLMRIGFIEIEKDKGILMADIHHIIADGIALEILIGEFIVLYNQEELPLLRLHYKDFSEWQNSEKQKESLERQENYWLKMFARDLPVLNLPTDLPRPPVQSFEGEHINFEIGPDETRCLKMLSNEENTTSYMVLLAIVNIWLSKLCLQDSIVVGTGVACRRHPDLQHLIGTFQNMLALINYPEEEKTFIEFLTEVKARALEAFENQDYQFEELVKNVAKNRDARRNPLFDVFFILNVVSQPYQPANGNRQEMEEQEQQQQNQDFNSDTYRYKSKRIRFDLGLYGYDMVNTLFFKLEYGTKLFKKETIERFISYFKEILSTVLVNRQIPLKEITITHHLVTGADKYTREDYMDFGF
jgi:tyrocidine synthetase-3